MERLDFSIPAFTSVAWVSDKAHDLWYPLLRRLNRALAYSTLTGVAKGVWNYRRIRVPGALVLKLIAAGKDCDVEVLDELVGREGEKGPVFHDVILRKRGMNGLLETTGVPACCQAHFTEMKAKAWREFLWESALATPGGSYSQSTKDCLVVAEGFVMGPFWQKLLVNLFSYPPCHLHCPETLAQTQAHLDWMRKTDYSIEADHLEEIAKWPVEWSVSHGICELRTPVVKLAYETDATDRNYRIQAMGSSYPELGAAGLHFPYRRRKFLRVSDSKSFKEGLKHGNNG